jgi:hypothetical protein
MQEGIAGVPRPGNPRRRPPLHGLRHQCQGRAIRRRGTPPQEVGPLQGPHPRRQGHRAAEPPLAGRRQNQIWCEIVASTCELLAWMATLTLDGKACRREPKQLRVRLFSPPGGRPAEGGASGSASPPAGPGTRLSPRRSPASRRSPRLTSPNRPDDQEGSQQGQWSRAHPARQPDHQARPGPEPATRNGSRCRLRPAIDDDERCRLAWPKSGAPLACSDGLPG